MSGLRSGFLHVNKHELFSYDYRALGIVSLDPVSLQALESIK